MSDAEALPGLLVVYDGECPFCASYVSLMALRKNAGRVALIDARSGDPRAIQLQRAGYDLDEGMVAIYGGVTYYGSDAVAIISDLSTTKFGLGRIIARVLRNPATAKALYPAMKWGRRMTLNLLGRKGIPTVGAD